MLVIDVTDQKIESLKFIRTLPIFSLHINYFFLPGFITWRNIFILRLDNDNNNDDDDHNIIIIKDRMGSILVYYYYYYYCF